MDDQRMADILATGYIMGVLQFGMTEEFVERVRDLRCEGYPDPGATNVISLRVPKYLGDARIKLTVTVEQESF